MSLIALQLTPMTITDDTWCSSLSVHIELPVILPFHLVTFKKVAMLKSVCLATCAMNMVCFFYFFYQIAIFILFLKTKNMPTFFNKCVKCLVIEFLVQSTSNPQYCNTCLDWTKDFNKLVCKANLIK